MLSLRKFRYTRTAVISPGYTVDFPKKYWGGVDWFDLPQYREYLSGNYWPPIELRKATKIRPHAVFGQQFGIYATEEIPKNTLIGEYGADLLMGKDILLCKKTDSKMEYSGSCSPTEVFLAPKDFAGFVVLINSGGEFESNCCSLRGVILGALRVLIVTKTQIKKGS